MTDAPPPLAFENLRLRTPRLLLRPLREADAQDRAALYGLLLRDWQVR